MRVAIAGLSHETHTFLPDPTEIDAFERGAARGGAIVDQYRGTNTAIGGFVDGCEDRDFEIEPILHASGGVSGTVVDDVYDRYVGELCDELAAIDDLDGVALFLHGAMVTETRVDPERDAVRAVREVVGDVPIVVAMDLHGNVDGRIAEAATAVCAYRSSPHVDAGETGRRAIALLADAMAGDTDPTTVVSKPGLAVPSPFSATTTEPARSVVERAIAWETAPELYDVTRWEDRDAVLDVSVFFGFAWSDVPQMGVSAVVTTDGDLDLAETIADDIAAFAWEHREGLTNPDGLYGVEEGVAYAIERGRETDRPICVLDAADRLAETTYVLRELLEQGADSAAVPLLWDPEAVEACEEAGEGSEITVDVGSKSSPRGGGPVELTGTVEWVGHNPYVATGPMRKGQRIDHGPTAIVDADGVWVQVTTEMDTAMIDADPIEQYGYELDDFDVIVSKSKTHFRAVYEERAAEIVIVDAPEYSPADLSQFEYDHVEGVYPVDER